jgi:hypothetical protein
MCNVILSQIADCPIDYILMVCEFNDRAVHYQTENKFAWLLVSVFVAQFYSLTDDPPHVVVNS